MNESDGPIGALPRSVLGAQVKGRMLQWILEGGMTPGARIIETRVARLLGTGQAPVREALRDLVTLGLVEMQPFRGARVREPAADELVEAMELRGELEAIAARHAIGRAGGGSPGAHRRQRPAVRGAVAADILRFSGVNTTHCQRSHGGVG